MRAWGPGAFENDEALDWVEETLDGGDAASVETVLRLVTDAPAEQAIETPEGAAALAAAEIVAAAWGRPVPGFPRDVARWVRLHRLPDRKVLPSLAREAVSRVRGERSDLARHFEASKDAKAWNEVVTDLARRLHA